MHQTGTFEGRSTDLATALWLLTQVVPRRIQVRLDVVERLQDVDGFLDADAGVQDVVLAVVGPQQLVDGGCPDGDDQVDQLEAGP